MTQAAELGGFGTFVVTTLWVHGPWSPLLPTAYEPVLVIFGRLYPPLLIAATGAVLSTAMEFINYRLYDYVSNAKLVERLKARAVEGRFVRWFAVEPFAVTWAFALTPLPDWGIRILAILANYPAHRYLAAFVLGRFPKFLLLAWLGTQVPITTEALIVIALAVILVVYGVAFVRRKGQ